MRIAVWHNLPSGGGKRALYYHVRGLVERGHAVEAWCPEGSDTDYMPLSDFVTERVSGLEVGGGRLSAFIERQPILGDELRSESIRLIRALDKHCRRCAEEINRGGFDVLFANSSVIQAVAPIGHYVNTPKVLYLQEPNRWFYEARDGGLPWLTLPARAKAWMRPRYVTWYAINLYATHQLRAMARWEMENARGYDRILVNSFFSRESVLRAYGLDARVCYLGVDTELFTDLALERDDFVVGLGEIGWHKGVRFVIEALARVPSPRPRLVWIGNRSDGAYHEEMVRTAQRLDVSFEVRTNIGDAQLVETLNRGALLAYAPRLEPFGLAPLEANACGMPVVAVAEGGVRETVVDGVNGLLVEHEPRAMAAAIKRLCDDAEYARRLGERGAEMVREKWSLEASIDRLERRFEELLEAKKSQQFRGDRVS